MRRLFTLVAKHSEFSFGWVERSEPHQNLAELCMVGLAALDPALPFLILVGDGRLAASERPCV